MNIDRQTVPLTEDEERELTAYVMNLYTRAKLYSRRDMYGKCYDAYNQVWRNQFSKEWQWIQDIALYMQTMTQLVDVWESTLSNYLFPNENTYLDVIDEVTGKFWKELCLLNYEKTGFIAETQQGILQAGITGDNAAIIVPDGPFMRVQTVPVSEIFYYPLTDNLTETSKIHKLRKTEYQLRNSAIPYFNLDKLAAIDWWKYQYTTSNQTAQINSHNPSQTDDTSTSLGNGFMLYQAYIHYFKFSTGEKRELTNFIATISLNPRVLIRFEQQGAYDLHVRNTWKTIPKGLFFGKGIVEPNLNPLSYMNTMATLGLVDKYLRTLQVYTYDFTDEITKMAVLQRKMLLQPGALIPTGRPNTIQPLQRDNSARGEDTEFNLFWKNEMQETTGALPLLSGSDEGNPNATATASGIRAQGASGRATKIARHWDETYIKQVTYRVIKAFQERFNQIQVQDPMTGQMSYQPGRNLNYIAGLMQAMGWTNEEINQNLSNPSFVEAIFRPIELSQIKPTGSTSVSNKLAAQANFNNAIMTAAKTPIINHVKWDQMALDLMTTNDIANAQEKVISPAEALRNNMMQIQQMLMAGVDMNPGTPEQPNPNMGRPLQPNQINSLQAQYAQMQQQLTGILQPVPIQPTPDLQQEVANMNNYRTGTEDQQQAVDPYAGVPGYGAPSVNASVNAMESGSMVTPDINMSSPMNPISPIQANSNVAGLPMEEPMEQATMQPMGELQEPTELTPEEMQTLVMQIQQEQGLLHPPGI